jgi:cytochrome oxidase Cu insertion factor (SCO1/SenC/PrrC family)
MGALGDPAMHSSSFVLVDRDGRVRGYYDAKDADAVERLKKDALALQRKP